jgi:hypothetical protein
LKRAYRETRRETLQVAADYKDVAGKSNPKRKKPSSTDERGPFKRI